MRQASRAPCADVFALTPGWITRMILHSLVLSAAWHQRQAAAQGRLHGTAARVCSLRANVDRLAFSVLWEMTPDAEVISTAFTKSIIRSSAALTYEDAQTRIDDAQRNDTITLSLRELLRVSRILRKRRCVAPARPALSCAAGASAPAERPAAHRPCTALCAPPSRVLTLSLQLLLYAAHADSLCNHDSRSGQARPEPARRKCVLLGACARKALRNSSCGTHLCPVLWITAWL